MHASIIISNYEPKGQLEACITHALAQMPGTPDYEVLLAEHGVIAPDLRARLQARASNSAGKFRVLPGPFTNRSAALNAAAAAALGPVLIFLESHVLAPPTLVASHCTRLADGQVTATQGAFVATPSDNWVASVESELRRSAEAHRVSRGQRPDEWHLHSTALRQSTFLQAGGFPVGLTDVAEVALFARLQAQGATILDRVTPAVHHVNHQDWAEYERALARRGAGVAELWHLDPVVAAKEFPVPPIARWLSESPTRRKAARVALAGQRALLAIPFALARWSRRPDWVFTVTRRVVANALRRGFLQA